MQPLSKGCEDLGLGALEKEMVKITSRKFVLPVKSGSSALITALKAGRIPEGSEVIIPSICCPAVLFAIQLAGYCPVLADVSLDDLCMNTKEIKTVLTKKTKAIVAVHSYGHYCQIEAIENFAKEKGLFLIEDACLAIRGTFKGKSLGSFGDVSIFSFGYDKIIDVGKGGVLVTDDALLFKRAKEFVKFNAFFSYDLNAQEKNLLFEKLSKLEGYIQKRKENARICEQSLKGKNISKAAFADDVVYWRYPVIYKGNRDQLIEDARKEGILITKHYKGLHQLKTGEVLKNAEYVSNHIMNIFIRPETPVAQIKNTIAFINEYAT